MFKSITNKPTMPRPKAEPISSAHHPARLELIMGLGTKVAPAVKAAPKVKMTARQQMLADNRALLGTATSEPPQTKTGALAQTKAAFANQ
jgi:hypothetical protein